MVTNEEMAEKLDGYMTLLREALIELGTQRAYIRSLTDKEPKELGENDFCDKCDNMIEEGTGIMRVGQNGVPEKLCPDCLI